MIVFVAILKALAEFLNQPVVIFFMAGLFVMISLKVNNITIPALILAINSINSQPFALFVLIIGFWMLLECKKYGIDTTIAGGVIGVASNMLQSQIKDAAHMGPGDIPKGSAVRSNVSTDIIAPAKDAVEDPKA